MYERSVPWWRRALNYALEGIRSGFGLFHRPAKIELANGHEQSAGLEKNQEEETVLTKMSSNPEPVALESVKPAEPASSPLPVNEPVPATTQDVLAVIAAPVALAERPDEPEPSPAPEPIPDPALAPINEPEIPEIIPITEPPVESEATQDEPAETTSAEVPISPTEIQLSDPIPDSSNELPAKAEPAPVPDSVSTAAPTIEPAADPESLTEPATDPEPPAKPAPPPPLVLTPKPLIKLETRDNEADLSPFSVVVDQVYDGPLDLLLDLIRKQDIDIYDIPISKITAQFLAYVNQLKASDVDVAGEFIYIASLLIHIKSKMLLPRSPSGPDEAAEDPRRELVERLLEHERFKNAAQMLQQKQMLEAATWTNPGFREFQDDAAAEPEIAADTVDLVRVFRDIIERARNRPVIDVEEDSVTVGQMIQFLARRLTMEDKPVALRRLLSHTRSERALIAMFLALLELVRLQAVLLRQDRQFSEIFIKKHANFDSVMNEGLANARDDWR